MIFNSLSGDYSLELVGLENSVLAYIGNPNSILDRHRDLDHKLLRSHLQNWQLRQ